MTYMTKDIDSITIFDIQELDLLNNLSYDDKILLIKKYGVREVNFLFNSDNFLLYFINNADFFLDICVSDYLRYLPLELMIKNIGAFLLIDGNSIIKFYELNKEVLSRENVKLAIKNSNNIKLLYNFLSNNFYSFNENELVDILEKDSSLYLLLYKKYYYFENIHSVAILNNYHNINLMLDGYKENNEVVPKYLLNRLITINYKVIKYLPYCESIDLINNLMLETSGDVYQYLSDASKDNILVCRKYIYYDYLGIKNIPCKYINDNEIMVNFFNGIFCYSNLNYVSTLNNSILSCLLKVLINVSNNEFANIDEFFTEVVRDFLLKLVELQPEYIKNKLQMKSYIEYKMLLENKNLLNVNIKDKKL